MRIIAGLLKNRALISPKGMETRPTSSKLRESLFNIAQTYIEDALFLDLFAGSGAMGLEALSRGAAKAVFVDSSRTSAKAIRDNLQTFDMEGRGEVICLDVFEGIKRLEQTSIRFDIIYADPPYDTTTHFHGEQMTYSERVLHALDGSPLLKERGMLFLEDVAHAQSEKVVLKTLRFLSSRKMGRATLQQFTQGQP